jgi:CHASE3 domain sensor protein
MRKKNIYKSIIAILVFTNVIALTMFFNTHLLENQTPTAAFLKQLGNVIGVSAGVPSNEINTLASDLRQWENELDAREQDLAAQEVLLRERAEGDTNTSVVYITVIGALLLVLVVMNFVLDWRRAEKLSKRRDTYLR